MPRGGSGDDGRPSVAVCIVTARRPAALDACLASLRTQEDPPPYEVIVVSDGDRGVVDVVRGRCPGATVGVVTRAYPGAARNLAVERARADLLLFLDDDVIVEPHLLRLLVETAEEHPDFDVFGGPNVTPHGSSQFQVVQGAVLSSLVASGPVRRRYGPHPAGPADERYFTLCNLAIRRDAMLRFAEDLSVGEESVLLAEMSRRGIAMRYDPALMAFHERRPTVRAFATQMQKYGRGRGILLARAPRTARLAYLVPSALLLYALAAPVLAIIDARWLAPLAAYAAVVGAGAAKIAWSLRRASAGALAAILIVVLHASYGLGVLRGVLRRRVPVLDHVPEWVSPSDRASADIGSDRSLP